MELLVMQHGEARPEAEDPERPLTDRAREELALVARAAARLALGVSEIRHSGKLRARQTAEILLAELSPPCGLVETSGLSPNDDPLSTTPRIDVSRGTPLLVGHLPHLSRLVSLLVAGRPEPPVVSFRNGALVCLRQEPDGWRLRWVLTPEMAALFGRA